MKTWRCSAQVVALTAAILAAATMPASAQGKKARVFILLGQSNMVGLGKVTGGSDIALEHAVKEKKLYPYLLDEAGNWAERKDVRFARVMSGRGGGMQRLNNEWMTVRTCTTIGRSSAFAKWVGDALEEPVLILKSCIGNRSLGWDLLPPGSERYEFTSKDKTGVEKTMVHAGYKDRPDAWEMDQAKGLLTEPPPWLDKKTGKPIDWYAGKQWDDDIAYAKTVLSELEEHYPGAKGYEVVGFFFWQGEKDAGNAGHAARYERNLVHFIKQVRKEFAAPTAKFVLATMGESEKGVGGNGGMILDAQLAVDGTSGKHPEFRGNVATIYTHPWLRVGAATGTTAARRKSTWTSAKRWAGSWWSCSTGKPPWTTR
jgi:hypothetical protein